MIMPKTKRGDAHDGRCAVKDFQAKRSGEGGLKVKDRCWKVFSKMFEWTGNTLRIIKTTHESLKCFYHPYKAHAKKRRKISCSAQARPGRK